MQGVGGSQPCSCSGRYLLQNDVPEDVFQTVSGAEVVAAAEDVKPQLGNGIPGHGLEFPDAVLPDPIFQVKL